MSLYVDKIKSQFSQNYDIENAFYMKKYMKNRFEFYGIKSPLRKELSKPFLKKENLPNITEINSIIKELWREPQRELQYFAMDLLSKYSKQLKDEDYTIFEYMIINKSWWDTVDYISAVLVGNHFKIYCALGRTIPSKWILSNNMWLNRSAILFQLKYKQNTDENILFNFILKHSNSKEFFLRKAIGWALREYSKTKPQAVIEFVQKNESKLSGLSKREALKRINKK